LIAWFTKAFGPFVGVVGEMVLAKDGISKIVRSTEIVAASSVFSLLICLVYDSHPIHVFLLAQLQCEVLLDCRAAAVDLTSAKIIIL
jgi:hypothetical protein